MRGDLVDHHFYVAGPTTKLRHDLVESNRKEDDISFWIQKHTRYATLLAREEYLCANVRRSRPSSRRLSRQSGSAGTGAATRLAADAAVCPAVFSTSSIATSFAWDFSTASRARSFTSCRRSGFGCWSTSISTRWGRRQAGQPQDLEPSALTQVPELAESNVASGIGARIQPGPSMNILGLNAFHGDASAALLVDGQLVAALEEERLNRIKHWAGFPALAAKRASHGGPIARPWSTSPSRAIPRRTSGEARPRARAPRRLAPTRLAREEHRRGRPARRPPARVAASRNADHVQHPPRRAPSRASGQRLLRVAVRRSGRRLDRRLRRLQQRDVGRRPRQPHRRSRVRALPAFARPVLHRLHAVPRLPEVRRRIQDDGPVGLRRAALRRSRSATSSASKATRSGSISTTSSTTPKASR